MLTSGLHPILICGQGRSGTTALMQTFVPSHSTFADQDYPFERRYLSYFAKMAEVLSRHIETLPYGLEQLLDFDNCAFGPFPWTYEVQEAWTYGVQAQVDWPPSSHRWLIALWTAFSAQARRSKPAARFYAEKAPPWLPAYAREVLCTDTIYLFRDPRDLFISSRLFCRKDPAFLPLEVAESDCRLACHIAFQFANIHANSVADTGRADAMVLRYEDMIGDKIAVWSRLRERFDLVLDEDHDLERHLTANTVAESVGRWQTESLPGSVTRLLTHAVGREMVQLGYEPSQGNESLQLDFSQASTPPSEISRHGELQFDAALAHVTVEGCDFWFIPSIDAFEAESVTNIWVCVSGGVGNHCSVYWRGPGQDFSEERSFHVAYLPAHAWRVLDFAVQDHALWQGKIEEIRLDIFNFSSPECRGEGLIKWMRLLRFR